MFPTSDDRRAEPRRRELAALQRQWELARAAPRFVRLTGEPWSGKTTLLRRLAERASREGWPVAAGRAPRAGGSSPFDALVDALDEHLVRADGELFDRLGAAGTRCLAPYFPSLSTLHDEPVTAAPHEVIRTLRALLELLAARGPGLLLVLDDVHRADARVLDFLEHLVRHPPDGPVCTVFAHRTPVSGRHPRRGLRALAGGGEGDARGEWGEEGGTAVRHIALRPLSDAEARPLLGPSLGPLDQAVALRDAGGVPGLLAALAAPRAAAGTERDGERERERERDRDRDQGWDRDSVRDWDRDGDWDRDRVLYGVEELASGMPPAPTGVPVELHTLSSLGWRVACAAAVAGDPFRPEVVAAVGRLPVEAVLRGLDELHDEGLVRAAVRGTDGLCFERPLVRALVLESCGAGWLTAARERAVTALRAASGAESGAAAAVPLAALLEDAGRLTADDVRTLAATARDGLHARPWRSVRALRRVAGSAQGPVEARLLLQQGLVVAGRAGEAVRGYREVWPRLHEVPLTAVRAEAALWHARALRHLGRHEEAHALLTPLPADPATAADVLAERAALALDLTEHSLAGAPSGVPAGVPAGIPLEGASGAPAEGAAGATFAGAAEVPFEESSNGSSNALSKVSPEAPTDRPPRTPAAQFPPQPPHLTPRQRPPAARPTPTTPTPTTPTPTTPTPRTPAPEGKAPPTPDALGDPVTDPLTAARVALQAALRVDGGGDGPRAGGALALLAAACVRGGRPAEARERVAAAAVCLDGLTDAELPAHLEALARLGEAELALGEAEHAGRHFGRGLRVALGRGQGRQLAAHALGLAGALLAGGETAAAAERAALALDAARRFGGPPLVAAAHALGARIGELSHPARHDHRVAQLSSREREIAELVATGCTNRAIAARLDISTKTVETYMSRIFKKLEANSRAQVAHTMGLNYRD